MTQEVDDLLSFMYACPFGLIELDASGNIGMINPHAIKLLLPLSGVEGCENFFTAMDEYAPELRNLAESFAEPSGLICDGHRIVVELAQHSEDGRPTVLSCSLSKQSSDRLIATLNDISAQVAQEYRMRQVDTWFSALIDEVKDHALLTIDSRGVVLSANPSFVRQTGYALQDVLGRPMKAILSDTSSDGQMPLSLEDQISLAIRDGWHLFEGWEKRADGERYWCQRLLVARAEHHAGEGPTLSIVLRDIAEPGDRADDLIELLTHDYLTGAINRMQFQKLLKREHKRYLARGQPLSLIILDLDDFKSLNDTYGHPTGDAVLKRVARASMDCMPENAVFARLGGEEFALLVPECSMNDAVDLAERLRQEIAELQVMTANGPIGVTVSLGCAEMHETDGSANDLIAIADRRLYQAKRAGRDRVAPEMA